MTKLPALLVLLLAAGILLPGCWSSHELTRWGFVQAAAIDLGKNGQLQLTVQIYRAGSSKGGAGGGGSPAQQTKSGPSFINIQTSSSTVHGATRDAVLQLGRRLQWSHMRMLLLGEDIARSQNIPQILDYFSRNNEPRGTVSLLITEGEAQQYLNLRPLIEGTMGQQLKTIEQNSFRYSGKTMEVSLTDVGIQAADDTPVYTIPFASIDKKRISSR
ncbi:Ger(x)C family spore germination protein [Paenibacillus sp. y28]|uniref:Ger(x)C family spore germination protein n=1 Tax=Paenibacillus sp. y28 TaxID=3129110 RepID=UPI003019435F